MGVPLALLLLVALTESTYLPPRPILRDVKIGQGNPLPKYAPKVYNTTSKPLTGATLNVHIVPHTHDDVGWLKTVDEYFLGANNSIQNAGVQYILDSVMVALEQNPDHKFIYVEIAFFKRWWAQQTQQMQNKVRGFVKSGQLEFINGGWCMSDEAAPFYVDMIDQQTVGHQFLLNEFGPDAIPTVGWQIDPFGHSSFMASAYALMGMNSWFFARIDHEDGDFRNKARSNEVIQRGSQSLGTDTDIFTGYMYGGYCDGGAWGFGFDSGSGDPPMNDDPQLEDNNIQQRVNQFVQETLNEATLYRTNNIMLPMGCDFNYENANTWFKNLDKLIHYVNLDGRVNAFYSTPSLYTKAKHDAQIQWPTKTDDWFPYADDKHSVWSGYFTSRQGLKRYVRDMSNFLQSCRQVEAQFGPVGEESSLRMWQAMGLAQHHDGVSGTSKQHTADDYARQLSGGYSECRRVFGAGLATAFGGNASTFQDCPLINQSLCDATTGTANNVAVLAYNPLAYPRVEYLRIPVSSAAIVIVFDESNNKVLSDRVLVAGRSDVVTLVFAASMPAMGYSTYYLQIQKSLQEAEPIPVSTPPKGQDVTISNDHYSLTFSGTTGLLSNIVNKASGVSTPVIQSFFWYNASTGNTADDQNKGRASGAYAFRPNCTENVLTPCDPFKVDSGTATLTSFTGAQVAEVRQVFSNWVTQTIRLSQGSPFIEVEYTVGPIPIDDGMGKEVISRWSTSLKTNATFWTDANGRDRQKRVRNHRPSWNLTVTDPVSGNYYPVNSAIMVRDVNPTGNQLTILTDRSQGGSSLRDGEIELMVQRRLLKDDGFGVGEPMNETESDYYGARVGKGITYIGTERVVFAPINASAQLHRLQQELLTFAPVLTFAPFSGAVSDFIKAHKSSYSGITTVLPPQVHLLTLADNRFYTSDPSSLLIRLAHKYEVGEDPVLSKPATVDLEALFSAIRVQSCTEMSLSANQPLSSVNRMTWQTETPFPPTGISAPLPLQPGALVVTLNPMQIRTFECKRQT
jgi:lysosomal alpha-mannosidase